MGEVLRSPEHTEIFGALLLEVGLHKERCRHVYTAGKRRERQNLIPAYEFYSAHLK